MGLQGAPTSHNNDMLFVYFYMILVLLNNQKKPAQSRSKIKREHRFILERSVVHENASKSRVKMLLD